MYRVKDTRQTTILHTRIAPASHQPSFHAKGATLFLLLLLLDRGKRFVFTPRSDAGAIQHSFYSLFATLSTLDIPSILSQGLSIIFTCQS